MRSADDADPFAALQADCGRCLALCCVGPGFSASADFFTHSSKYFRSSDFAAFAAAMSFSASVSAKGALCGWTQ